MAFDGSKVDLGSLSQVTGEQESEDFNLGDNNLEFTMSEAVKVNPEQHAKNLNLRKKSGFPSLVVETEPEQVEQAVKKNEFDFSSLRDNNPVTASYLTNIDNAIVAQDDVDVLKEFEDKLTKVADVARAFPAGFVSSAGFAIEGAGRAYDASARLLVKGLDEILPDEFNKFLYTGENPSEIDQILKAVSPGSLFRLEGSELKKTGDMIGAPANRQNIATGISGALGQMAQQVILSLVNPTLSISALFSQGVDQQGERQERTGTEGRDVESDLALFTGGAITAISEKVGLDKLLDRLPPAIKNRIMRNVTDLVIAGGIESLQEVTEGIGHGVLELHTTNPDAEIFKGLETEAIVAGGAGAIARGVLNLIAPKRLNFAQHENDKQITKSSIEQDELEVLNTLAQKSKLKERSKESFKQFVEEADGDKNTTVFIDGAQASLYLQSKTPEEIEADPALKLLSEQAQEASALGGDVQVPVADFLTDVADTEHYEALSDSMTLSTETTSRFRQEQVKQEQDSYIENIMSEAQENISEYVEAQEIYDKVKEQLIDTGTVSAANASVMAQIVPAWATVQARRRGKTVQQVYQDSGLVIEGPQTGKRARLEGEMILTQEPAYKEAPEIFDAARDKFLSVLPEDAESDEVLEAAEGFGPEYRNFIKALERDDWLGFDFPSQATNAALSEELENFEVSPGLKRSIGRMVNAQFDTGQVFEQAPVDQVEELSNEGKYTDAVTEGVQPSAEIQNQATVVGREVIKKLDVGFDTLDTPEKVARATQSLSKSAQEKFWAIATGESGTPLAVLNHTMGLKDQASVDPATVAGWAVSVPDAVNVWFSHNHPSGKIELSQSDIRVSKDLSILLEGSGVSSKGIMAVTPDLFIHEEVNQPLEIPEADMTNKVDLVERTLEKVASRDAKTLNSPDEANSAVKNISPDDGIVLLNNAHVPIGFLPIDFETEGEVLRGGRLGSLLKAIESTNASAVMLKSKKWNEGVVNTANMFNTANIRVLDAFIEGESRAQSGRDITTGARFRQKGKGKQEARGYYDPANSVIRLTEASDLSTFLHEFAHFMYEMEVDGNTEILQSINNWYKRNADKVAEEANGYLGEDFDVLKQEDKPTAKEGSITTEDVITFLDNKTTGDTDKDSAIRRAVHEQFARGFETYLMEGKSPSIELRNAFRTFARWLSRIYQTMKGQLNVDLDDEAREFFNRLLATDEQIQAAEVRAKVEPMFTDAVMAGMTEEEFIDYQKKQEKVKDVQTETLRDKIIKELTRRTQAWWQEEKKDIIDEEIDLLNEERVYITRNRLRDGDLKLDHATVKELVGEEKTNKLGRKSVVIPPALRNMTAKGMEGVHPDQAAAFFGYSSGSEMLTDLIEAPNIKTVAEANAEARMIETHGDILNDGTLDQQADDAVANEERGKLILNELKTLARGTNAPTIDRSTIKALAETNIGKLSFRQIHPGKYRRAEIRAAQESARMLAEGNREGAAAAKMRQVMNYYLGMAANNAKNETTKIVDRMSRYGKKKVREAILKAEGGYWEQIVKILSRFEFRKSATLAGVESLNTWVNERNGEAGDALVLSNAVLNESYVTHWKNVPFSDLQGINDSLKNIEHVARYANKLTRMQEEIDFNKLVDRWLTSMDENVKTRFVSKRTDVVEGKNWGRWFMAQMTKIPFMASWLDGGERVGISHQIMVQPFTEAYNAEIKLWEEVGNPVMKAIENRSKEDIKRHNNKIYIAEISDNLYGHQIIAVALNTGNQSNLRKLLLGEQWADPEVDTDVSFDNPKLQAVLSRMTRSDWKLVQDIWDQMELLYPQLAEVHRRTTGLTPPKIEATPITTPDGTVLAGGYYPVKYDPNRSHRAALNEDKLNAQTESMFSSGVSIQASVNTGATNERTGYYAPIRLSLDVVPSHFQETIHYITHHDAVREVNRLTRNEAVTQMIKEKLGPEEYAQIKPWLNDIAKDGREAPTKMFWDDMLQRLRFGVTLGVMGFKASTGIIQISGLSNTIAEVGMGHVMQSMRLILGSTTTIKDAWNFAVENSQVLEHRAQTMDREIKNAMKHISGKRGVLAAAQEASMKHIALIQTYMVDLPSWHAAYLKGMKDWGDETRAFQYADWVIENVQGSGATKDMARIMRGQSETGRMFTMFMTFFSSLWNMERDLVKGAKTGRYSPSNVAAKAMFLFTIPVLFEMIMRGELGEPDDEDDRLQKMLTKVALFPVQSIPFIRDIASATTGEFGYNISPLASIIEQGTRTIPEIVTRGFTDDEITKGQVKGATKFLGATVGIPGVNQAWATGEHLFDVIEEGEELTVHQFLFGPKRE